MLLAEKVFHTEFSSLSQCKTNNDNDKIENLNVQISIDAFVRESRGVLQEDGSDLSDLSSD